jgi:TolB protein
MLFAGTVDGWLQICMTDINGGNLNRLSHVRAIEVSPRVSPDGKSVLFISGRSGIEQMWRMNIDGSGVEMVTNGEGYVANPAWHPKSQLAAFAWTKGFEPGAYNIFIMDVTSHKVLAQLTTSAGKNENPWWAPDGTHLVFQSTKGRATQIYSMLADGTHSQQLTTQGNNTQPVWANAIN